MNARSMICAGAIALAGGLSVAAPAHAALTLIVAAGGGGGAGLDGNGLGGQITTSGGDGVQGGAGGTNGSGGNGGGAGGGAGWLSNGGNGSGGTGGLTSPSFAGGLGANGFGFAGFGGGGGGDDYTFGGGGGGGYSGGGGGSNAYGGGGGGSYVNPVLRDVLETPDLNAGNGLVQVGLLYFTYTGSVQEYTIPTSAFYFVAAFGAQGGSGNAGSETGGDGAGVGGEVYLTAGTELDIVVGGAGGSGGAEGGGGGGSFLWDPVAVPPQPVPEPSAWAMMMLGFAGLAYAGWRGQRKTAAIRA